MRKVVILYLECFPLGISRLFQLIVSAIISGVWKSSTISRRVLGKEAADRLGWGMLEGGGCPSPAGSAGSWGASQEMLWTQRHLQAEPGRPLLLSPQAVAYALPSCTHAPILVTHPHVHRYPHTHKCVGRQTSTFRHQLNCVNKCMWALVHGGHSLHTWVC